MTALLPTFASTHRDIAPLVGRVHHADIFALCDRLPDASVDMILCDLPYGVTALKDTWDVVIPFAPMWAAFKRVIKPRGAIVLTASQPFTSKLVCSNLEDFKYQWYWKKSRPTNFVHAKNMPLKEIEDIVIFFSASMGHVTLLGENRMSYYPQDLKIANRILKQDRKTRAANYTGLRPSHKDVIFQEFTDYPSQLLEFESVTGALHPTQKPVALFEYLIKTYTQPGELVFDPCAGSGTTAVAARNTGREFIVGDLTHEYVLIARDRLNTEFGVKHTRKENDLAGLPLFKDAV